MTRLFLYRCVFRSPSIIARRVFKLRMHWLTITLNTSKVVNTFLSKAAVLFVVRQSHSFRKYMQSEFLDRVCHHITYVLFVSRPVLNCIIFTVHVGLELKGL